MSDSIIGKSSYYNVTTTDVTTISAIDTPQPTSVTLCNYDHSGDDCMVELYLENSAATNTYRIIHDVIISGGQTLILEHPELTYDTTTYALKFKLASVASSQRVDIKVTY